MLWMFGIALGVIILTTFIWIRISRPIDCISLVLRVLFKLQLHRILIKKPSGCKEVTAKNGFKMKSSNPMGRLIYNEVLDLKMRKDDVVVATFVKAGTTWMQEITWLLCNDADFETAKSTRLVDRFAFLEAPYIPVVGKGFQSVENWPTDRRRFIKTHLPFQLLPYELQRGGKGKMICVVRNPKDNCVSFFHFHRAIPGLPEPGTWNQFLTKFCDGELELGDWFEYVHKYWEVYQERKDQIHFVSYESLKKNLKGEVSRLAKFLEVDISNEKIEAIADHCTFKSMSENKSVNYSDINRKGMMDFSKSKFMRKGEVGDWKNYFTINENLAFDELYRKKTGNWTLKFEFEPTDHTETVG